MTPRRRTAPSNSTSIRSSHSVAMKDHGPEEHQEDRAGRDLKLVVDRGGGNTAGANGPHIIVTSPSDSDSQAAPKSEGSGRRDQEGFTNAASTNVHGNPGRLFEDMIQVRPSKIGGLGVFAVRDLKKNEIILVEKPLLRTTHSSFMRDFDKLTESRKAEYLSLHGTEGEPSNRVERIKNLNSFWVPDGIAIFATASRFNHACWSIRNVRYKFDNGQGALVLTICQEVVPAGSELLINYGGSPAQLYRTYGFVCACGGCHDLVKENRKIQEQQEKEEW
ncbi:hypothetical protein VTK26DRAFT_6115 [Humicola hyalothermophila]